MIIITTESDKQYNSPLLPSLADDGFASLCSNAPQPQPYQVLQIAATFGVGGSNRDAGRKKTTRRPRDRDDKGGEGEGDVGGGVALWPVCGAESVERRTEQVLLLPFLSFSFLVLGLPLPLPLHPICFVSFSRSVTSMQQAAG
jgi:hypothetical protein